MSEEQEDNGDDLPDPEDVIASPGTSDDQEIGDDLPDPEEIIEIHDEIVDNYNLTHTGTRVAAPRLQIKEYLQDVDEYSGHINGLEHC